MLVYPGLAKKPERNTPAGIPGLVGWWRQGDFIASGERASQWSDSSGNARHLLQATGANQPIALPWSGENYSWHPGTSANNHFSAADAAPLDLTTKISIAIRLSLDDWETGAAQTVFSKWAATGNQRSFILSSSTVGFLSFQYSTDGGATSATCSSTAKIDTVVSNFGWIWLLAAINLETGLGNFYYAPDAVSVPTSWTLLGSANQAVSAGGTITAGSFVVGSTYTIKTVGTTDFTLVGAANSNVGTVFVATGAGSGTGTAYGGIYSGTASLECFASFNLATGKCKRAILYNGVVAADGTGGTIVADFNPAAQAENANAWADSYGNTWTRTGTTNAKQCQVIGRPQIVGDGAAHYMRAAYTQAQPCTRIFLARFPLWTSGRYMIDGVGANSAAMVATTSTPRRSMNAGSSANENAAATLGGWHAVAMVWDGASSKLVIDTTTASGGNPGTTTTGGLTILADGAATAANFGSGQFAEIAEWTRIIGASELSAMLRYINRLGNLGLAI